MIDPNHDKKTARQAYMSKEAADIRRHIDQTYGKPVVDFPYWILSKRKFWRGDEVILDINPSDGVYFDLLSSHIPEGNYFATDVSFSMLEDAQQHEFAPDMNLSLATPHALPFPDATFDIVIADHILYHLDHLDMLLTELHRVLRDDGVLMASTDSQFTMGEFDTLTRRALTLLGRPPRSNDIYYGRFVESFALENGAVQLARCFRGVARYELPSTLVFTDTPPVMDFLYSNRVAIEPTLPPEVHWDAYMNIMNEQVRRLISHFGELVVNRLSGVLLATNKGDFASSYFEILDHNIAE